MSKRYITTKGEMDKMWCDLHYPRPVYFDRPTERMPKRELCAMLAEHVAEARRVIDLLESLGEHGAENQRLRDAINALHDFRNAVGIFSASGAGMPHLWEV